MFSSATFFRLALLVLPFVAAEVHDITVGGADGKLEFNPQAIAANPGDQVVFHFQQKNHTVTQSSFASPCGPKDGGFNSGFMPVAANVTDNFPTYTVNVPDTNPIWVYCAQAAGTANSHCGMGMVFAINCGPDGSQNSFTSFRQAALAVGQQLQSQASSSGSSTSGGYGYGSGGGYGGAPAPSATVGTTSTGSSSSSGAAATHTVTVGASAKLAFDPPRISAAVNDVVVFQFMSKNHTATQSSFAQPCTHLTNATTNQVGFDSGFMPIANGTTQFPTWSITVNDTQPIWAYCRQKTPTSHCNAGMVFAINSVDNGPKNFTAFQASAMSNGTSSSGSGSSGSGSGSGTSNVSGAPRLSSGVGLALGAVGAVFALLL